LRPRKCSGGPSRPPGPANRPRKYESLRYFIISDIHSNFEALQAVVAEIDTLGAGELLCLGDIVGYGPSPNECCDLLRARNVIAIAGNHDEAAATGAGLERFNPVAREALAWTQDELSEPNRAYLEALPRERTIGDFLMVHGSPVRHFDYILDTHDAEQALDLAAKPLTFVGHSHVAEVYYRGPSGRTSRERLLHGGRIDIVPEYRYIVNVGSVGQPRDRNPQASFGCYDNGVARVEIRRVTYDVDAVRARMVQASLPRILRDRLVAGW